LRLLEAKVKNIYLEATSIILTTTLNSKINFCTNFSKIAHCGGGGGAANVLQNMTEGVKNSLIAHMVIYKQPLTGLK
jgi:hypothetical protein